VGRKKIAMLEDIFVLCFYTALIWPFIFVYNLVSAIFYAVKEAQRPPDDALDGRKAFLRGENGRHAIKNMLWAGLALFLMTFGLFCGISVAMYR